MNCYYCDKAESLAFGMYVIDGFSICYKCRKKKEKEQGK
jgi:hypothetical protein